MQEEQPGAEGVDQVEDKGEALDNQFAEADAAGEAVQAPTIEEIAAEIGWTPKDKFRGPPDKWKPADRFILDGKDIQERTSRELKEIRSTLDIVSKTSGAILQERLADERARLASQYANAVEKGDPDEAWKAANAIRSIDEQAASTATARRAPDPEAQRWAQQNAKVMQDPIAAKRALAICNEYANAGYSTADQLQRTEALMRQEFPHLFDAKPAPQVNEPAGRSAGNNNGGAKTARDMPKEARAVAHDMVERGLIPSVDAYAKNYFAEVEKRKQA